MFMVRTLCRFAAWVACLGTVAGFGSLTQAQAQTAAGVAGDAARAANASAMPSVAFFYGQPVPLDALSGFDAVVVEPDSGFDPAAQQGGHTAWFAYVSVGEVSPQRQYYAAMPKEWLVGHNAAWASRVVDQDAPGWPAFYVRQVIAPLWRKGYRGFFLDTLDSYQLIAKTDAARQRQQAGLVAVIRAIKARYPRARLMFNRGFEILPQVHDLVYAVAFESLYSGWDQGEQRYTQVPPADRSWLLGQAKIIREQYALPVIAIDYCAPGDEPCTRETVQKICKDGLVPYVADGALQTVGVGRAGICADEAGVAQP
jgi:polysaccharide biosynthesis protein PelA